MRSAGTASGSPSDPGRLQTFTFQTLLFFALFSLVSIRERRAFWRSTPSFALAMALGADALIGVLIGLYGLTDLRPLPFDATLAIVGAAAVCSLGINELVKLAAMTRVRRGLRRRVSRRAGRHSSGTAADPR